MTIAMVARNAAGTIGRAVSSAVAAGPCPILLVDDGSDDDTITIARQHAGDRLTIIPNTRSGVGQARQTAIENIQTPFGMWLDADDTILPERPALLLEGLAQSGADMVLDTGRLVEGTTGADKGKLEIPAFIQNPRFAVRNIERNWYPLLHSGFRADFARSIGYDTSFECSEDYDFLLRAIMADAEIHNLDTGTYLYSDYPGSISRNVDKTRHFVAKALVKHSVTEIEARIDAAGIAEAEKACILASSALYRGATTEARDHLKSMPSAPMMILQYGVMSDWLAGFLCASSYCLEENWGDAKRLLETLGTHPEVSNNLGACLKMLGKEAAAEAMFQKALSQKQGYHDATHNLKAAADEGLRVTTHPFRQGLGRDRY